MSTHRPLLAQHATTRLGLAETGAKKEKKKRGKERREWASSSRHHRRGGPRRCRRLCRRSAGRRRAARPCSTSRSGASASSSSSYPRGAAPTAGAPAPRTRTTMGPPPAPAAARRSCASSWASTTDHPRWAPLSPPLRPSLDLSPIRPNSVDPARNLPNSGALASGRVRICAAARRPRKFLCYFWYGKAHSFVYISP